MMVVNSILVVMVIILGILSWMVIRNLQENQKDNRKRNISIGVILGMLGFFLLSFLSTRKGLWVILGVVYGILLAVWYSKSLNDFMMY